MRHKGIALYLSLALGWLGQLQAQDLFQHVEYQAGKDGFADKLKGSLVVAPQAIRFMDQHGQLVFSIPMENVKEVRNDVQIRDASVGKKLLWGGLAGSRKQEFVLISTESSESAEGVVFMVKQNESLSVVAKIQHAMKAAAQRQIQDSTSAPAVTATIAPADTAAVDSARP